jgi:signal transduction histidine kinase
MTIRLMDDLIRIHKPTIVDQVGTVQQPAPKIFRAGPVPGNGRSIQKDQVSHSSGWINHVEWSRQPMIPEINEITALYNLSVALDACPSLDEIIQTLYKESSCLLDTTNFAIALYDADIDTLNFSLVFAQGQASKPFSVRLTHSRGLTRCVLTNQTPLLVPDLAETGHADETNQLRSDQPIRSWLGVPILNPILTHESARGVLVTWHYEPNALTDHELWLLSAIGTQAAIAIRRTQLLLAERERVIEAGKQAREKLARDLHDGATQLISSIKMRLDFCELLLTRDPARLAQELDNTQELVEQAIQEIRTLLFELRPLALETHGLADALQIFIERRQVEVEGMTRLTLKIETYQPNGKISRQDNQVETALFAIVREAVNNALKHARADHIIIQLKETLTQLYIIITDDGDGFDIGEITHNYEQRNSLGMLNIRERTDLMGGELRLKSAPGQGTQIIVQVPKADEERRRKRNVIARSSLLPENEIKKMSSVIMSKGL